MVFIQVEMAATTVPMFAIHAAHYDKSRVVVRIKLNSNSTPTFFLRASPRRRATTILFVVIFFQQRAPSAFCHHDQNRTLHPSALWLWLWLS